MSIKEISKNKIIWLILIIIFLIGLNIYLVLPLFKGDYTRYMGSIESVFLADAKYLKENFPNHGWQNQWYGGFPFHTVYTPIIPYLLAVLNSVFSFFTISHWYRILVALAYVITPVGVFFLTRQLLKKNLESFIAALGFSLISFPALFLGNIGSLTSSFEGIPWSLLTAVLYGEGPHLMAMALLPFTILFFLRALEKPNYRTIILSAIFVTLTALTNWISLVALAVVAGIVLFTEMIRENASNKFKTAFKIAIISYGFSAFWFNISFVKASLSISSGGASGGIFSSYTVLLPLAVIIIPIVAFVISFFKKRSKLLPLFMIGLWFSIFYLSAHLWFSQQKMILPQPNRYIPEMGMAGAILFGIVSSFIFGRTNFKKKVIKVTSKIIVFLAILILIFFGGKTLLFSERRALEPRKTIENTTEYEVAQWLEANIRGEERAFLTGTHAFWLNTFVDVPQIRGGNEGVAKEWTQHATYQIYHEPDADISIDWFKAYNIGYVVVNFSESDNVFHDYIDPSKFATYLTEVYNKNGDTIYKIDLKYPGLAQVVGAVEVDSLVTPKKGDDEENIEAYSHWVDDQAKGKAEIEWINNGHFIVRGNFDENEILQVQMSFDSGWKARVGHKATTIKKDVIGNMYLIPRETGNLEITFKYGKTWDVWLGYLITLGTISYLIYYRIAGRKKE